MTTLFLLFDTYTGECACSEDDIQFRGAFLSAEAAMEAQPSYEKFGTILNPWKETTWGHNNFPDRVPLDQDRTTGAARRSWEKGGWFVVEVTALTP